MKLARRYAQWITTRKKKHAAESAEVRAWKALVRAHQTASQEEIDAAGLPAAGLGLLRGEPLARRP